MAKAKRWSNEDLTQAVKTSKSMAGVLRALGVSYGMKKQVLADIQALGLNIAHFNRKATGLKHDGTPNAYWRRFKERLDAYAETPVEEWTDEHVLGHVLRRYHDYYGSEYALSYTGPPSKCKEMYTVRRVLLAIGAEQNMALAKQYVDWVFDDTIIPKRVEMKNIMFFIAGDLIYRFKMHLHKSKKITRATSLPKPYLDIADALDLSVATYGDLAFAKMAVDQDPDTYANYGALFAKLKEAGFNEEVFSKMEA